MELLVISKSKLKIMLTAPDMIKYDLTVPQTESLSVHDREALRHLFRDAKAEIGFDTEGARLFVQLYSSKEGGCEIFVTKLPEDKSTVPVWEQEQTDAQGKSSTDLWARHLSVLSEIHQTSEDRLLQAIYDFKEQENPWACRAYRFSGLPPLLAVCHRLAATGYGTRRPGRSRVYIVDHGKCTDWYLLLELPTSDESNPFLFLSEYAVLVDPDSIGVYLAEHGRLIASENAVEVLKTL